MLNEELKPASEYRVQRSIALRVAEAGNDAFMSQPTQFDNEDEAHYADKSGTYTKGVLQTGIGLVDLAAYASFKRALASGTAMDFEHIVLGGTRTQNGPQGGLAFFQDCPDSSQFSVPPAPPLASEEYAAELIELYWASLLRDVSFVDYATDPTAAQAVAELSALAAYAGPRDASNKVTSALLFRGLFQGEQTGPYVSQFLLKSTNMGALPVTQKYMTNAAGQDFMLSAAEFLDVQNGKAPVNALTASPAPLYLHDGRGLAAYTHSDVLYQAYFIANLVLNSFLSANPAVLNPGNPYAPTQPGAKTQNGFGTMGGPDIASSLAAAASAALNAVWYQKWWVHLRHRPESGGGIVHLMKTGSGGSIQAQLSPTVLNSKAVQASHTKFNSWLLPQAFPEGSPTHPAYPTGHGAVAGACITVLKFFYDGAFKIPTPQVPNAGRTDLVNYVPPAGEPPLDINGELHKLASNISFGHGIHAGIHWRSDTLTSIQLGEAVALSFLRNKVRSYNEKFSVSLMKLDGTQTTISNT
ncbi:phosphoesterase [Paraburkholderia sp. Cpub6]|uniref:phosphoesterase n=1 Tax=Paraburkholderia sp. Cpub6 TaxID=2723094 RepID=UPI001612A27C|nr:phosphoesterase [Paraburkholderia sp. Cpub6]MBB5460513.1 hypothetical protein [Paraburkholderia sp. Cpub6]